MSGAAHSAPDLPARLPAGPLPWRRLALLGALAAAALLPFAWSAYKIDDPLFIWCAQHIVGHPLDPYGFQVNWYGTSMPMWEVMRNPPLASYYLALFGVLFGWSEPVLHGAMIAAAAGCVAGTAALARHFTASAFLAGLILLVSPVFMVSGTTVMCDVLMLAFLVWAAAAWVSGIDRPSTGRLMAAGALLAAATLTKFTALLVLPAFLLYGRGSLGVKQLAALALPVAALVVYLAAASARYGGSLFDALALASSGGQDLGMGTRLAVLLVFLGGCHISVLCLAPLCWPGKRVLAAALAAVLPVAALLVTGVYRGATVQKLALAGPSELLHVALFGSSGIVAVLLCVSLRQAAARAAWLLVPWIAAVVVFAAFAAWAMSGRYLLPLAPPLAIAAACVLERRRGRPASALVVTAVVVAATASFAVARADAALAGSARTAAERISARLGSGVWFQGHWGFQYYMELGGGRPLEAGSSMVLPGEHIVVPGNNANTFPVNPGAVKLQETLEFEAFSWLSTMDSRHGAGFYASVWGPLPFAAGVISPEKYYILSVVSP